MGPGPRIIPESAREIGIGRAMRRGGLREQVRRLRRRAPLFVALAIGALTLPTSAYAQSAGAQLSLPEVSVTATTPLSAVRSPRQRGAGESRRARPAPAAAPVSAAPTPPAAPAASGATDTPVRPNVLTPEDFDHATATSVPDALLRRVPSVFINQTSGNEFMPDVQYRGFLASPVLGTPQGLAVYQNGARINEAFGDTVNWDFIPETAINRLDVVSNNPAFGLNALGGAISIEMKNGFTYQGREAEVRGGSFWRRAVSAQALSLFVQ